MEMMTFNDTNFPPSAFIEKWVRYIETSGLTFDLFLTEYQTPTFLTYDEVVDHVFRQAAMHPVGQEFSLVNTLNTSQLTNGEKRQIGKLFAQRAADYKFEKLTKTFKGQPLYKRVA
jgi:hypothetical protein